VLIETVMTKKNKKLSLSRESLAKVGGGRIVVGTGPQPTSTVRPSLLFPCNTTICPAPSPIPNPLTPVVVGPVILG
jgi:hypothetical protein